MRKTRKNLNNKEIERAFLRDASDSGIIAVYMYKKTERNIVNVMKRQERNGNNVHESERGNGATAEANLLDGDEDDSTKEAGRLGMRENIHDH